MALVFDTTPLADATWEQAQSAQSTHTKRIRVTGFTTSTYYAMLNELYNDPGLPQIGSPVDALFQLTLLRGWEVEAVQCGAPTPGIILRLDYSEQSIFTSTVADANGPVVFRQRSIASDWTQAQDRLGADITLSYKGCAQLGYATIQRSLMLLECERYEDANPYDRARPLLSTVNAGLWNNLAARSVLFYDMNSDTRDDNTTWFVNYSFLYDPLGHDRTLFYIGQDGTTPADYDTDPLASVTPKVYPESNFSPLNITLP